MTPLLLRGESQRHHPPLLLLHGLLGAPESWRPFVNHLHYPGRIVAAVLPGHGRPAGRVADGFEANVRQLSACLDQPCHVAGYSMGGRLALGLAAYCPARVLSVIAVGAHPGLSDNDRDQKRLWEHAQLDVLAQTGLAGFVRNWEELPLFASQVRLSAAILNKQRALRTNHEAAGIARALVGMGAGGMPDLIALLESAGVHLRLVAGSLDATFVARGQRAAQQIWCAHFSTIEGAGHNALLESPKQLARICDDNIRLVTTQGETSHDFASV